MQLSDAYARHPEGSIMCAAGTPSTREFQQEGDLYNTGALIITIGFWSPLCKTYSMEISQSSIGNYLCPYVTEP